MLLSSVCEWNLLNGGSFSLKPQRAKYRNITLEWAIWYRKGVKLRGWMATPLESEEIKEPENINLLLLRIKFWCVLQTTMQMAGLWVGWGVVFATSWGSTAGTREEIQGWEGRSLMEGWQSEKESDRMSFGFSETSVLLHHWIRGVNCVPLFIQLGAVNNGAHWWGSLSVEVRTQAAEGNSILYFCSYSMCVSAGQTTCLCVC